MEKRLACTAVPVEVTREKARRALTYLLQRSRLLATRAYDELFEAGDGSMVVFWIIEEIKRRKIELPFYSLQFMHLSGWLATHDAIGRAMGVQIKIEL